jgi:hypothetical protein
LNDPLTVTPFRFRSGKKKRLAAIARESDGRKTPLSSISCAAVGAREGVFVIEHRPCQLLFVHQVIDFFK